MSFGNNEKKWKNPLIFKRLINKVASARCTGTQNSEEFSRNVVFHQQNAFCRLIDCIPHCWIYRLTFINKYNDNGLKSQLLEDFSHLVEKQRFFDNTNNNNNVHNDEKNNNCFCEIPFPGAFLAASIDLNNNSNNKNNNAEIESPFFDFNNSINSMQYISKLRDLLTELNNDQSGSKHLESFCLTACLENFPPV